MYNSLSNIQKHLYSLIKQNNPEYLQQSINEEYRSKNKNLAVGDENPRDFEGMDETAAARLRARRTAGETIRNINTAAKVNDPGKEDRKKAENKMYYQNLVRELPADPTKWTDVQAANVAMLKTMTKVTPELKGDAELGDLQGINKTNLSSDKLSELSVKTNQNNTSPSSQSRIALRYQKKAEENALPLGDRPISPFYKTTRNQFKSDFGRDFDTSGGANTSNMRALVNNQTNLGGRLTDIEKGWQDARSEEAQVEASKGENSPATAMIKAKAARDASDKRNRVNTYKPSDFDVPPSGTPGREIPTKETDSGRQSGLIHQSMWDTLGINPDAMGPGSDKQAMGLTGKSVNSKVSRIA